MDGPILGLTEIRTFTGGSQLELSLCVLSVVLGSLCQPQTG